MKTIQKISRYFFAIMISFTFTLFQSCGEKTIDYAKAEPEITLKAKRLYTDFSKNPDLASQKYLNKIIQLDGKMSRIEPVKDTLVAIVYNYSMDDEESGIIVNMLPGTRDQVKTLSKRYEVSIKGLCTAYDGTNVIFEYGSLAK